MQVPWPVSERGGFEPYTRTETPLVLVRPPWKVSARINPDEEFQKEEQGHGWHGYFEGGKEGGGAAPGGDAGTTPETQAVDVIPQFLADNPMGFTLGADGSSPTTGFQVGGVAAPLTIDATQTPQQIADGVTKYLDDNKALLAQPDMHLGGWQDNDGNYVIEVSEKIDNPIQAGQAALDRNQQSIWDNAQAAQNEALRQAAGAQNGDPPVKGEVSPYAESYGTGDFGVTNPNTEAGVQPISGVNGEGTITASVAGHDNANTQGLSQKLLDKGTAHQALYGMPAAQEQANNVERYITTATAQSWILGNTFYPRANGEARSIEKETADQPTPVSAYQAAGVIAALSPQTPVGSNIEGAHIICGLVASGQNLHFDQEHLDTYNAAQGYNIQNDKPLLGQTTRDAAASAAQLYIHEMGATEKPEWGEGFVGHPDDMLPVTLMGGPSSVGAAIELAAGQKWDGTPATPANSLGISGVMKVRDFFNNIIDPANPNYVTIDGFELGIAKGTGAYTEKVTGPPTEKYPEGRTTDLYSAVITHGPSAKGEGITGGATCYTQLVDAVQKGTDQANAALGTNLSYSAGQGVSWYTGRMISQGQPVTAGNLPAQADANPPQTRDITNLDDAIAILQQGPKDSALGVVHTESQDRHTGKPSDEMTDTDWATGMLPGQYDVRTDMFNFSDKNAELAKNDVTTRLSGAMTASTGDLLALSGLPDNNVILQEAIAFQGQKNPDFKGEPAEVVYLAKGQQREAAVSTLISTWAQSSNDSNQLSLALQQAAEKEFALPNSMQWGNHDKPGTTDAQMPLLSEGNNQATAQEFVRTMYNDTQNMLKEQGVASINLTRAQSESPADLGTTQQVPTQPNEKGVLTGAHQVIETAQMRPMSSWSASTDRAVGVFGHAGGVVLNAQVPASQILSTPRTGFGCLNEHEFVTIGNVSNVYQERAEEYGAD